VLAAVIALSASVAGLTALVFFQGRELRKGRETLKEVAELKVLLAASRVANADKQKAINALTIEQEGLKDALQELRKQRDELLHEAIDDPSSAAAAVRGALERLRDL
jgi:signal transduction histidine kinase